MSVSINYQEKLEENDAKITTLNRLLEKKREEVFKLEAEGNKIDNNPRDIITDNKLRALRTTIRLKMSAITRIMDIISDHEKEGRKLTRKLKGISEPTCCEICHLRFDKHNKMKEIQVGAIYNKRYLAICFGCYETRGVNAVEHGKQWRNIVFDDWISWVNYMRSQSFLMLLETLPSDLQPKRVTCLKSKFFNLMEDANK